MKAFRTLLAGEWPSPLSATSVSAAGITWKIQTNANPSDLRYPFMVQWAKDVQAMTNGRIEPEMQDRQCDDPVYRDPSMPSAWG